MKEGFQKLLSRKFLAAIAVVALTLMESGKLQGWHLVVVAAVAAIYIVSETALDHRAMFGDDLERGLELGREALAKAEQPGAMTTVAGELIPKAGALLAIETKPAAPSEAEKTPIPGAAAGGAT